MPEDPVTRTIMEALRTALTHNAAPNVAEPLATALTASLLARWEKAWSAVPLLETRDPEGPLRRLDPQTLAHIVDYMRARLDQPITLEELAREASLSKYYFLRLFAATVGTSPHRYLTALRVGHGAELLLTTRITVAGIAGRCGYATASRFSVVFRQHYGTTPGHFRRKRAAGLDHDAHRSPHASGEQ